LPRLCLPGHGPTRGLSAGKERRRVGGHSRRRSPRGLGPAGSDCQARRSYAAAVNEISAAGPGPISRLEASRSARPHHRYKRTPKSCPTRAGRLKAATVAGHVEQLQTEAGHHVARRLTQARLGSPCCRIVCPGVKSSSGAPAAPAQTCWRRRPRSPLHRRSPNRNRDCPGYSEIARSMKTTKARVLTLAPRPLANTAQTLTGGTRAASALAIDHRGRRVVPQARAAAREAMERDYRSFLNYIKDPEEGIRAVGEEYARGGVGERVTAARSNPRGGSVGSSHVLQGIFVGQYGFADAAHRRQRPHPPLGPERQPAPRAIPRESAPGRPGGR
jgi:hypothetical protein